MSTNTQKLIKQRLAEYSVNHFLPSVAQKRAKAAFWSHFFSGGEVPPSHIDATTAAQYSGCNEVVKWYEIPGFYEWFCNGEEFRQRVEYVSNLALDVLEATLLDDTARRSEQLVAAKMVFEIAAKFPKSQNKENFADEKIALMSKKELEDYIASQMQIIRLPSKKEPT